MNKWEKTLERFRELGGIAENIELRDGVYGRGLFPIDQNRSVKLSVPDQLLAHQDWLQLNASGDLILSDACDWNDQTKKFYLDYQADYGLGGRLMHDIMYQQRELNALPNQIKKALIAYGFPENFFQEPTPQACLDVFIKSYRIHRKNKLVLMPVVELVNHDSMRIKSFDHEPHLGVSGKFSHEILVDYGLNADAPLMYQTYLFSTERPYAFSGSMAINLGQRVLKIGRFLAVHDIAAKIKVPKVHVEGNTLYLSFLVIGDLYDKHFPYKIFEKIMSDMGMPSKMAIDIFEGIVNQNKNFFLQLLKMLEPLDGNVVKTMRTMARNQLLTIGVLV